ncbi:MAG: cyclic nucleotide-binding domain-containing protein [bacterium]
MSDRMRFVGPLDRALFLKTLPFFTRLPISDLAVLAHHLRERFFRKGSVVLRQGEPIGAMYIIVEGSLRTVGGERAREAVLGPEQGVGFLSFLSRSQEGVRAIAEVDTLTLELDTDVLLDVYEDHFPILHHAIRSIATRMLQARMQTPDGAFFGEHATDAPAPERSLDLVERIRFVRNGSIFQRANLDTVAQMARVLREVRVDAGTPLWSSGDRADSTLLIVSGTVRCALDDGARAFLCGPSYPLGNLESIARYPRWYDAVAHTPLVGLRADTESFFDILEDHFEIAMALVSGMASGLIQILRQEETDAERDPSPAN